MNRVLEAFKAVAEPSRLRLLALCARGELTVTEVTEVVGQSQPRVSRHLKVLCAAGLLDRFREQNWVYHRIPLGGPGAELARGLLRLLPAHDPLLRLDRERLERVLARRAEQVRGQAGSDAAPTPAGVDARIGNLMAGEALGDLLDIGTGTGRMLRLLGVAADTAVGIDISTLDIVVLRSRCHHRAYWDQVAQVNFPIDAPGYREVVDLTELSYENIPYDVYPIGRKWRSE